MSTIKKLTDINGKDIFVVSHSDAIKVKNDGTLTDSLYKLNRPYYEDSYELIQEGIDMECGDSSETVTISKDSAGTFTYNVLVKGSTTTGCYIKINAFDVEPTTRYFVEFYYSSNKDIANIVNYIRDARIYSGTTGDRFSFNCQKGFIRTEITPSSGDKYIIFRESSYVNNTQIILSHIKVFKANAKTIREKFDEIDSTLESITGGDDASDSLQLVDKVYSKVSYSSTDIANITHRAYSITTSGTYGSDTTYKHVVLPVSEGNIVKVVSNENNGAILYFFSNVAAPTKNAAAPIVSGSERMVFQPGSTEIVTVPVGANGLFVYCGSENAYTPQYVIIYSEIKSNEEHYFGKEIEPVICNGYRPSATGIELLSNHELKTYLFRINPNTRYSLYVNNCGGSTYMAFSNVLPPTTDTDEFTFFSRGGGTNESGYRYMVFNSGTYKYLIINNNTTTFDVHCYESAKYTTIKSNSEGKLEIDDTTNVINSLNYTKIDISKLTERNYGFNSQGYYDSYTPHKNVIIPVEENQYIKITSNDNFTTKFGFIANDNAPVSNSLVPWADYCGYLEIPVSTTVILRVPAGANYLLLYKKLSTDSVYTPAYLGISDFSGYDESEDETPAIVKRNDIDVTVRILSQISATTRSEYPLKPLVLLHFSDLHGNLYNMARINDWRNYYSSYIDDTVHTGDLATTSWSFNDSFWTNGTCSDILNVIGNHDTRDDSVGASDTDLWHVHEGIDAYNRYIGPFVENWNVVQPTDAATSGLCYYYKDYSEKKVRLIALDPWNVNADYQVAQKTWFQTVLDGARANSLSVVIIVHYGITVTKLLDCPFSKLFTEPKLRPDTPASDAYVSFVTQFIKDGGDFVCWLCGHLHYGKVGVYTTQETVNDNTVDINQVCIHVPDAARSQYDRSNDNSHISINDEDPRSLDIFNVIAVDTYFKRLTLFRVGSDYDRWGRHIGTCCVDYKNGTLLNFS